MRVCVRTHKTLSLTNFILHGKSSESIFIYSSNLLERRRYIHNYHKFLSWLFIIFMVHCLKRSSTPFFQFAGNPEPEEGWEFTCQNGPKECKGNIYQACLLTLPTNQVDSKQQVQVVHCIMSSLYDVYQSYDSTTKFKSIVQYEMPDSATTKVHIIYYFPD